MTSEGTLTDLVRALYERHPYPHYPLLARPRWQEGYLASSAFVARLAADVTGTPASKDGTRLEPGWRRLVSIDLSSRSVNRARLRLALARGKAELRRGDINDYLATGEPGQVFSHIDAYGVLHHLPNPRATLGLIAQRLAPGGTARIMVYNSRARDWIWNLQRFHGLLGIDSA
ncbi:MAG: methyltransferase domain-containing protein, partial [Proteobacteria bacterium]|nr:methyltransferase domain-containing protein [Pseudomonadota bacterium]